MDKVEDDTDEEVVEEAAANMKTELTSQISPVTFNIHSRTHSQTIQVRGSLITRCAQITW